MKIDLKAIDLEQFMVHEHIVNGQVLYLVQPQHIGAKFTQANKHLRSSVWDADGNLVSAAFPKFVNWGENPENFPVPTSLEGCTCVEKIDGSLLVVSRYAGFDILRTRGTVDATKLDNGHELEIFKQKYHRKLNFYGEDTSGYSYLFEWVSPLQRIILNYGDEPEWYLVGIVMHDNYSLATQDVLDEKAKEIGCPRPSSYTFPDITELMTGVEKWKGKEGVVVYSNYGQMLHKVKGFWYLSLHRMKEAMCSVEKVIEVWFENGRPSYLEFEDLITTNFDWELWQQVRGDASRICDGWKGVKHIVEGIDTFVNDTLRPLPTRRAQAEKVLASYGQTNRAAFVFKRLDNKPLGDEDLKKLLYQVMKK